MQCKRYKMTRQNGSSAIGNYSDISLALWSDKQHSKVTACHFILFDFYFLEWCFLSLSERVKPNYSKPAEVVQMLA